MAKDIIIIALLIIGGYIFYHLFLNNPPINTVSVKIKNIEYHLEIAKTIPQKTKGLMDRKTLPKDGGMIFVSDIDIPQAFWMKNTLLPLDMIFVKSDGTVINILTAVPEPQTPDNKLKIYQSTSPAKYVIELNAGDAKKLNLLPDDKIDLSNVK